MSKPWLSPGISALVEPGNTAESFWALARRVLSPATTKQSTNARMERHKHETVKLRTTNLLRKSIKQYAGKLRANSIAAWRGCHEEEPDWRLSFVSCVPEKT